MKKSLILFVACLFTMCGYAQTSGTSGGCKWSLNEGVLTISKRFGGNGAMADYTVKLIPSFSSDTPWNPYYASVTKLVIEEGVTRIGRDAFFGMSKIAGTVTLPSTVTQINSNAFTDCQFTDFVIADGSKLTNIEHSAFSNCGSMVRFHCPLSTPPVLDNVIFDWPFVLIGGVFVPEDAVSKYKAAPYWKDYPDIIKPIVPREETGDSYECTWTVSADGKTLTISKKAGGDGMMEGYISSSLAPWKKYANTIEQLVIEEGVSTIGYHAFSEMKQIKGTITIPSTVRQIAPDAFLGCGSFTDLVIADNSQLAWIGNSAFVRCSGLKRFYCPLSTPPELELTIFDFPFSEQGKIYVPANAIEKYRNALYWSFYGDLFCSLSEPPSLVVTIEEDIVDGDDGETSLREAANYAISLGDQSMVAFAEGVEKVILNSPILLAEGEKLYIRGDGKTISGGGKSRHFETGKNASLVLEELVLNEGYFLGDAGSIYVNSSNVILRHCKFTGNSSYSSGGAIYNKGGSLQLTNCFFCSNSASKDGGAICCENGFILKINASTIANNYASKKGGGIYAPYISDFEINNSIISANISSEGYENLGVTDVRTQIRGSHNILNEDLSSHSALEYMDVNPCFIDDFKLWEKSPAVDAGDASLFPKDASFFDLDFGERLVGCAMDIGAFESKYIFPNCLKGITGDCRWSISEDLKTLKIDPLVSEARMDDYYGWYEGDVYRSVTPWADYRNEIQKVDIGDDVSYIGAEAFCDMSLKGTLTLSSSIKEIGVSAFARNDIGVILFPLGSQLQVVHDKAFSNCKFLESIYLTAETPPAVGTLAFEGVDVANCVLRVPEAYIPLYQSAPVWQDFYIYKELRLSSILLEASQLETDIIKPEIKLDSYFFDQYGEPIVAKEPVTYVIEPAVGAMITADSYFYAALPGEYKVYVTTEGVKSNEVTLKAIDYSGVEAIDESRVRCEAGILHIEANRSMLMQLYSLDGKLISEEQLQAGHTTRELPQGVNIVVLDGKSYKLFGR